MDFKFTLTYWRGIVHQNPPPEGEAINDRLVLEKIREAKQMIARQANLPGAWNWLRVQGAVHAIGDQIPLRFLNQGRVMVPAIAYYEVRNGNLYVLPDKIKGFPVEFIAGLLVHEATHAVEIGKAVSISGFTREELFALFTVCGDFGRMLAFSEEALAYRNSALWELAWPKAQDVEAPESARELMISARRWVAGDLEAAGSFARALQMIASIGRLQVDQVQCEPAPIVRGPRSGQLFFPSDIAPEIIVPLLNLVQ